MVPNENTISEQNLGLKSDNEVKGYVLVMKAQFVKETIYERKNDQWTFVNLSTVWLGTETGNVARIIVKLSVQSDCLISTKNDPSRVPQMHSLLNGILVTNGLRKFILSCRGFSGGHGQKLPRELQLKHFGNFAMVIRGNCFRNSI